MSRLLLVENLKREVACIHAAQDRPALELAYEQIVGPGHLSEQTDITDEEVRQTLLDFVREACFAAGVHVTEVGLGAPVGAHADGDPERPVSQPVPRG